MQTVLKPNFLRVKQFGQIMLPSDRASFFTADSASIVANID